MIGELGIVYREHQTNEMAVRIELTNFILRFLIHLAGSYIIVSKTAPILLEPPSIKSGICLHEALDYIDRILRRKGVLLVIPLTLWGTARKTCIFLYLAQKMVNLSVIETLT